MSNALTETWDFSTKKWLYWTGMIGFVITCQFYLWIVAIGLYFAFDREKNKMENYQIDKAYVKFAVITGNIMLVILFYALFRIFNG